MKIYSLMKNYLFYSYVRQIYFQEKEEAANRLINLFYISKDSAIFQVRSENKYGFMGINKWFNIVQQLIFKSKVENEGADYGKWDTAIAH